MWLALALLACKPAPSADSADSSPPVDTHVVDSGGWNDTGGPEPFADAVVSFQPGAGAGYGQDQLPDVVLGPPYAVEGGGSLHVLSLGQEGVIVLELSDIGLVDGPGADLLVFENPFPGWTEPAFVAVSEDGETWSEWTCTPETLVGCAGVNPVYSSPANGVDPTDPEAAGGDAFDLAELGLAQANFVRIRDSGTNDYAGVAGGFDLDAIAVVNGEAR